MFGNGQDDNSQQAGQDMAIPADLTDSSMTLPAAPGMPQSQPMQPAVPDMMPSAPPAPAADDAGMGDAFQSSPAPMMNPSSRDADAGAPNDLINIKQEALQSLKPLVGHLDQAPEEAFRTTMMMIQAADDQSLIPQAYEAAKAITDEKTRAQALLDVVNEINYFTAQSSQPNQD